MTKEEHQAYAKEYRKRGYGSRNDRRYYWKHAESIREKNLQRYHAQKLSQSAAEAFAATEI